MPSEKVYLVICEYGEYEEASTSVQGVYRDKAGARARIVELAREYGMYTDFLADTINHFGTCDTISSTDTVGNRVEITMSCMPLQ